MNVLVDTPIWSFALRRKRENLAPAQRRLLVEWETLVRQRRVILVGPVRQELLSGVREPAVYERLRERLRAFNDAPLVTADYEQAAYNNNRCQKSGVAGSAVDFLLCAVAQRLGAPIFTTDADFKRYADHLAIRLHRPGVTRAGGPRPRPASDS